MRSPALFVVVIGASLVTACNTPSPRPAVAAPNAGTCTGASLALGPETVVGSLDGKPVTLRDLGDEARAAEEKALWEYCDAVYATRSRALEGYFTEKLVEKAAAGASVTPDDWVRGEMMKRMSPPSDEEVAAFYERIKGPETPPLELLKGRIVMALQQERGEAAMQALITELKGQAALTRSLPDVRSPPRDVDVPSHTARKGGSGAKVRVVEFADFECPYCSKAAESVGVLAKRYGDKVEFVYRHFPLQMHPNAQRAAEAAQCAARQGKFWEMHDKLFEGSAGLDDAAVATYAGQIGLDKEKLAGCLESGEVAAEVAADLRRGNELGVEGTPTFFVNGRPHLGNASVEALSAAIDAELTR